MAITYNDTKKDLPSAQLHKLFVAVGWSDGTDTPEMIGNYNVPFIHSTVVISAWDGDRLIGAVRALSDTMFRSVIYDLLVLPEYQNRGIGKELLRRCVARYPKSEWLVGTEKHIAGYYEKNGFQMEEDGVFLSVPCKLFTRT